MAGLDTPARPRRQPDQRPYRAGSGLEKLTPPRRPLGTLPAYKARRPGGSSGRPDRETRTTSSQPLVAAGIYITAKDRSMGILSSIFDKLRGRGASPQPTSAQQTTEASSQPPGQAGPQASLENVDVDQVLGQMASKKGGGGNFRESIVDLLKLLDLDSSLTARKELARELNVNAGAAGSAEQNIALHNAVMRKVAENGGRVPGRMKH